MTSSFPISSATVTDTWPAHSNTWAQGLLCVLQCSAKPLERECFINPLPRPSKPQVTLQIKSHRPEVAFGRSSTWVFSLWALPHTQTRFQVAKIIWSHSKKNTHSTDWEQREKPACPAHFHTSLKVQWIHMSISLWKDFYVLSSFFLSLCLFLNQSCVCMFDRGLLFFKSAREAVC